MLVPISDDRRKQANKRKVGTKIEGLREKKKKKKREGKSFLFQ